jgi:hypothetical protein
MTVNDVILVNGLNIPGDIEAPHLKKKIRQWYEDNSTLPNGPIKYSTQGGSKYKVTTSYQNQDVSITGIIAG